MANDAPSPKPLLDKLGVKPGMHVAVIALDDAGFLRDLAKRAEVVSEAESDVDIAFLGVEGPDDMAALAALGERIKRDGAIWTVFPKGRTGFNSNHVMELGLATGLVDVKVVSFSETHTALKWMIRLKNR